MTAAALRLMPQRVREFCVHHPASAALAAGTWRRMRARLGRTRDAATGRYRVLEIGCGALYPYVLLFHSAGVPVVGIDVLPLVRRDPRVGKYLDVGRERGTVSALRRVASDLMIHAGFDRPLGHSADIPIRHSGLQLVRMDASRCGFADASFDLIYSSACFEHLSDVDGIVAEMDRLLTPGGIAEIEIHLFASMTGGHEPVLDDHREPPVGLPLWGHLLDPGWQAPLFLNRWRERQFSETFASRFDILDRQVTSRHGEQYLTAAIADRLSPRYSPEELTTESVLFVLQKR